MKNHEPTPSSSVEQQCTSFTSEVTALYTELRERFSIANPDALPKDDLSVDNAMEAHIEWSAYIDGTAAQFNSAEARLEADYLKSIFFVDAGFDDERYVYEVLDWISQDYQRANEMGYEHLASRINSKMEKCIELIAQ